MTDPRSTAHTQVPPPHDYAGDVVTLGRAEPENPAVYNVVRDALDAWFGSTAETMCCAPDERGFPTRPNHNTDEADPWCDGLARYVVSRLRIFGVTHDGT